MIGTLEVCDGDHIKTARMSLEEHEYCIDHLESLPYVQGLALHVENAGGDPNKCVSAFMCWGGGGREVEVLSYGDFWQFLPGSVVGSSA